MCKMAVLMRKVPRDFCPKKRVRNMMGKLEARET